MSICDSCKKEFNAETILERAAAELLPPGLEIYDFGGGCTVVPVPDFPENSEYLTSHMAAICEAPYSDTSKMLAFRITNGTFQRSTGDFSEKIVDDLKRALSLWPTEATPWKTANFRKLA